MDAIKINIDPQVRVKGEAELRAAEEERWRLENRSIFLADMWEASMQEAKNAEARCTRIRRTYFIPETPRPVTRKVQREVHDAGMSVIDALASLRRYRSYITKSASEQEQEAFGEMSDVLLELIDAALDCNSPQEVRERFLKR